MFTVAARVCPLWCAMAIIDQSEIDGLLAEATTLADEAADRIGGGSASAPPPPPPMARSIKLPDDPRLRRILRLRVPVIVQLAERTMSIATVRGLAVGAIIEFDKSVEDELELRVNNRPIGTGACVKVGENFGLRVTRISSRRDRLQAMADR